MQTYCRSEDLTDPAAAASAAIIRACVHCGFCIATCPTYVLLGDERDSPRGRIVLMQEMIEQQSTPSAEVVRHIDRCLSCLACMTTCPSGVHYGHLVDHARAYINQRYRRPWFDRVMRAALAAILPHQQRFRSALAFARLVRPFRRMLPGWDALKPLTAMLDLAPRLPVRARPQVDKPAAVARRGRVVLMKGCAEPILRPEIGAATERLLTRMGYDVRYGPGEGCCGALCHHLGREAQSLAMARRNIDVWIAELDSGLDAIVFTTSGCGTTIKDYGWMLRDDAAYAAKAARVSGLAKDISEFVDLAGLPAVTGREAPRVAYHSACSMQHGQKIDTLPRKLLADVGFAVKVPREANLCCGSAGTYNILQSDIARQLGDRKVANLAALDATVIATGNIGCIEQIAARTAVPVVHTVELLDWATGGPLPPAMAPAHQWHRLAVERGNECARLCPHFAGGSARRIKRGTEAEPGGTRRAPQRHSLWGDTADRQEARPGRQDGTHGLQYGRVRRFGWKQLQGMRTRRKRSKRLARRSNAG